MNAIAPHSDFQQGDHAVEDFDMLIVGAGISGIAMAVHMARDCPDKNFTIIERRAELGGTWDLFRYPGIRSDSDMYTMSLESEPWLQPETLGEGHLIKGYLADVAARHRLIERIRFGLRVVSANWRSETGRWFVEVEGDDGRRRTLRARYLHVASGYYDYDEPYVAQIPGRDDFAGTIVHPQFWPKDFDYSGKRVVVIGSGATAITLVPAMAGTAAHVTMLQRSPTWISTIPQRSKVIAALRAMLPAKLAHRVIRFIIIRLSRKMFREAREQPEVVSQRILERAKTALGDKFDPVHFTPTYAPWDQRLCFVPDNDLFKAIVSGRASVVTDRIARIDATGIALESGKHLDADIIVTATGLQLAVAGKIAVSVDGVPVAWNDRIFYKGCMLSGMPNFSMTIVYSNISATLRSEIVGHYVCRVLRHMDSIGAAIVIPSPPEDMVPTDEPLLDLKSGYLTRSLHLMPRNGRTRPWRLDHDYLLDREEMRNMPIDDGNLRFTGADEVARGNEVLEAAE